MTGRLFVDQGDVNFWTKFKFVSVLLKFNFALNFVLNEARKISSAKQENAKTIWEKNKRRKTEVSRSARTLNEEKIMQRIWRKQEIL